MRIGCSSTRQSSRSGFGRSRNCVSKVPTEPEAVFEAGVAMRAIISPVSVEGSVRCLIRIDRHRTRASPMLTTLLVLPRSIGLIRCGHGAIAPDPRASSGVPFALSRLGEYRIDVVVFDVFCVGVDRLVFRLERFEDGEQLRFFQHVEAARPEVQQLDVAAALADGDVFPRDSADAGAIEIGDVLEVDQDTTAPLAGESVHALDELGDAVFEHETASEIEDRDAAHLALDYLHAFTLRRNYTHG